MHHPSRLKWCTKNEFFIVLTYLRCDFAAWWVIHETWSIGYCLYLSLMHHRHSDSSITMLEWISAATRCDGRRAIEHQHNHPHHHIDLSSWKYVHFIFSSNFGAMLYNFTKLNIQTDFSFSQAWPTDGRAFEWAWLQIHEFAHSHDM